MDLVWAHVLNDLKLGGLLVGRLLLLWELDMANNVRSEEAGSQEVNEEATSKHGNDDLDDSSRLQLQAHYLIIVEIVS